MAAAVGGTDELKQAAKRVRDAKRRPQVMSEELGGQEEGAQAADASAPFDEVKALKRRVAQLEKENDALRKQVLNLLEKSSRTPDGHPNSPTYGHLKFPHPESGVRAGY